MGKFITYAALLTMLSGCGVVQSLSKNCGGFFGPLCVMLLGETAKDVEDLEKRVDKLENGHAEAVSIVNSLDASVQDNELMINALQTQANSMQVQLAQIAGYESIAEIVDPCGDGPGYDEVLLKTSSGKYIAYFEGLGSDRFLSVLEQEVNYETTDAQECQFYISTDNEVVEL